MTRSATDWNAVTPGRGRATTQHADGRTAEERRNLQTIVKGTAALNAKQLSGAMDGFSPDFEWTSPLFDRPVRGLDAARRGFQQMLATFPDVHFEIQLNFASGRFTQTLYRATGTRVVGFRGLPPVTGRFDLPNSVLNEFTPSGKRLRSLSFWDPLALLEQMGVDVDSLRQREAGRPSTGRAAAGVTSSAQEKRNLATVHTGIRALNQRDVLGSLNGFGPRSTWFSNVLTHPIVGLEAAAQATREMFRVFPDAEFNIDQIHASDNFVFVQFLMKGFRTDSFLGLPPRRGKYEYLRSVKVQFSPQGVTQFVWDVWDGLAILQQQGFVVSGWGQGPQQPVDQPVARQPASTRPMPLDTRLTAAGLDRARSAAESGNEAELRRMLRRNADFVMAGQRTDEGWQTDGSGNLSGGQWSIDLENTRIVRTDQLSSRGRIGTVRVTWRIASDSHPGLAATAPGAKSPTGLRRIHLEGTVHFVDDGRSEAPIRGFGFVEISGQQVTLLAAALRLEPGTGQLATADPSVLTLGKGSTGPSSIHAVLRIHDPTHALWTTSKLSKGLVIAKGTDDLVLTFRGSDDPDHPVEFQFGADGDFTGAHAVERLFLADFQCGLPGGRLKTRTKTIGAAGEMRFDVRFAASTGPATDAGIDFTTHRAVLDLSATAGPILGRLEADIVAGRAFPSELRNSPLPCFHMGGLAPIRRGFGAFAGAKGWVVVNSLFTLAPRVISSVVTVRLERPAFDVQEALHRAWS